MQFLIKVDSGDLAKAVKQVSAWDGKTRLAVEAALKKGTKAVQRGAVQRAAVRTGAMKKTIKSGFSATKLEGRVYSTAPYAHFVEYGAKGAVIKPKKAKALKFGNAGETVYTRKVQIPKRAPKPFMRPAYESALPDIIRDVEKAVAKK